MIMGRIRTLLIKKLGKKYFEMYKDKLTTDYEKNKLILKSLISIKSKKIRNKVIGYITKLMKSKSA